MLEIETVKSDIAYTKNLSQISYNKLTENGFLLDKNPYESDEHNS